MYVIERFPAPHPRLADRWLCEKTGARYVPVLKALNEKGEQASDALVDEILAANDAELRAEMDSLAELWSDGH